MATVLICRRFPRLSRVTAFSTTAKCKAESGSSKSEQEKEENPETANTRSESAATIQLLNPLDYRVLYNPSAYAKSRAASQQHAARSSGQALGDTFTSPGKAQVQHTFSNASSQALPSVRNALPKPKSKPLLKQTISACPSVAQTKEEAEKDKREMHDSKEDPRMFQNGRPEYKSLSYDKFEPVETLPLEEGDSILHSVAVCKGSQSPGTITDYFCKLSRLPVEQHAALVSEPRFNTLCRCAVKNIRLFSTSELVDILKACVRLVVPPTHPLLNACENEFCRRVWDMNLDQLLLVADCWRCLERSVPSYLSILFSYANMHWKDLTLPQFVQLLYIIGEGRRSPADLTQKVESMILKYLDSFMLEEVGAVCLGLFKSLSGISDHVMRKIADRVYLQMEDMSTYALVNVLKLLRYSRVDHLPLLKELGKVIPTRIPTVNIQGIMHITLTCSSLHYFDEGIMAAVAMSLPSKVTYCRSKDAAKFLWSFGCLDYEPPNEEEFYCSLIEQMHRKLHEFRKYPEHLLTGLLGLAFVKRFPEDLIDYALRDEFVQKTRGSKYELKKDLFTLSKSVEIECPSYQGSRLSPQLYQEMTEMVLNFAEQEIYVRPEIVEAVSLLESMLGGPEYVKNHMILPHTRSSDLEVHLAMDGHPIPFNLKDPITDKKLKDFGVSLTDDLMAQLIKGTSSSQSPVEVENEARTPGQEGREEAGTPNAGDSAVLSGGALLADARLQVEPKSECCLEVPPSLTLDRQPRQVKLAIQVSNRNHYCYCSKRLLGLHCLKRRQLQQLGYVVVELPFWEWFPLLKRTRLEKLSYLHYKVFDPALLSRAG
ncbi:FAST kinase domain-containing protein 5, mitochondrial [Haliaeetus albicilla]|nr:PREDICTED: FAST kinase domain-containing protein 5 isoform X1 [Haliaeetus albicilla]XP_009911259.1 PREDICTED: FAST kinase domain-containing protein 5 isoform X1 [Haliaeetus albicilla]XP_010579069.1 PREDICTED: FAST kinase domain-containing protein 5 isoform X1 [Haliaeetus leucocephalus]XP_010579070.1 PREDICTED: FAST kinase domain-containing protein 5 isoform X1 [Haliaeetus leucocephalus]XP_010579071.1 PREDICTED: FAST kinase domain-containing protein 5 isoform X1 [Haliaeetus leucocephalus]XP_